jgi:hypothetical protein
MVHGEPSVTEKVEKTLHELELKLYPPRPRAFSCARTEVTVTWAVVAVHTRPNRPCPVTGDTCRSSGRPISTLTATWPGAPPAPKHVARRLPPHHTDDDASRPVHASVGAPTAHRPFAGSALSPHVPLTGAPRATSPAAAPPPSLFNPATTGIPSAPRNNNKTRSQSRSSQQRNPGVPDRLHFRPRGHDPFRRAFFLSFLLFFLVI